ncbi:hypothetical protein AAZX31_05G000500 [Glycine max]|uniref:uncharacterized protein LOC114411620 n=1 Tax=Glycine soja TaxID=3848 RepID=UPI0010398C48|nr:uncharacterized protein LOC114411620 [Glycine soja]XP_028231043.1 uncharacterized protein LOC114411620 [Glycine soja]KAG5039205.1 hypothetical protein JHK85_011681 [Glycine max]KAG5056360.1 hypothetical protein JHK86_011356 [Glycine max]KAG5153398.1 hypothetical protein JHK82_011367 [Glycine max]
MASNDDESVLDPWAFILELSHISPSQEQILATAPFVGAVQDTATSASHDIDMLPLPDSVPEDVFHTPEEASLPTSPSENHCVVNYAFIDVDDVDAWFELGKDSELGSSDVHVEEVNGEEMGNLETLSGDVSISVSESAEGPKSSDGVVESPGKKKSEQGKNKSAVSGEQKKTDKEAGPGLRRVLPPSTAASTPMTETGSGRSGNGGGGAKRKFLDAFFAAVKAFSELQSTVEELNEDHKEAGPELRRVLPPSITGSTAKTGSGRSGNGGGGEKRKAFDVFALLKAFSKLESTVEENNDDHRTLLDVARAKGVTFPRPRWWPEGDNFDPPPPQ